MTPFCRSCSDIAWPTKNTIIYEKINSTALNDRLFSALLLGMGMLFYIFFALYDGVYIAVDSPSYISMEVSREPLYPILLAILRTLFSSAGESFYLQVMVLLQSLLAAFAAWILARYLQKRLELPDPLTLLIWAFASNCFSFVCVHLDRLLAIILSLACDTIPIVARRLFFDILYASAYFILPSIAGGLDFSFSRCLAYWARHRKITFRSQPRAHREAILIARGV